MAGPDHALTLWALLGTDGSLLRFDTPHGRVFVDCAERERCVRMIRRFPVWMAPHTDRHPDAVRVMPCLWVAARDPITQAGVEAFTPRPTLALREHGRLTVYVWWLEEPAGVVKGALYNRRLARCLGAAQKDGDPETFMFHAKACTRLSGVSYDLETVAGHVADPPGRRY